ncbi:MAG: SH3 domain-containing protein [Pseudonocardiaceae bacterium]
MSWKFVKKRWTWLLAGVVLLYVLALNATRDSAAGESSACRMRVTADVLNVRSGPSPGNRVVGVLTAGAVIPADLTVSDGFRQLEPGRWASQLYLDPMPGCNCG